MLSVSCTIDEDTVEVLKKNGIELDTIYDYFKDEQIYWIKEKTRALTKKEIEEEIEYMRTEEEMTDEEISAYLKRLSVLVSNSLVLTGLNETPKSTKRTRYIKTIPYSMLIDYIESKIPKMKWSLVCDKRRYRIRFKGKMLIFSEFDGIGDCLASFLCYLKINNYIEV